MGHDNEHIFSKKLRQEFLRETANRQDAFYDEHSIFNKFLYETFKYKFYAISCFQMYLQFF